MFINEMNPWRWALCLGALGIATACHALEPKDLLAFGVGPVVARPHLTVSEQYDDNVFYQTYGNPQADFITILNPGINLRLGKGGGRGTLALTYDYSTYLYANNPHLGQTSTHAVGIAAGWQGNKTTLGLTGSWNWTDTVYGGYEAWVLGTYGTNIILTRTNIAVPNQARTMYSVSPSVNYSFTDKLSGYLNGSFGATDFKEAANLYNVNSWRTTLGANYNFRPKLGVLSEVFYGQDAADPNGNLVKYPHMETIGGSLGLRGDLTPRINATLKGGYQQSQQGDYTFGAPAGSVSLNAQLSEKSTLGLTYSRTASLSVTGTAAPYISDNLSAQFQRSFGNRKPWVFSLGASYGLLEYQTGTLQGLNSDYFSATTGLSYAWKLWLRTSLNYQYQTTWNSNKTVDYNVSMVTLSASIGY